MALVKLLDPELPFRVEWLRTFLAVVEEGGATAAARAVRLSQPAVSTHLKGLEENLGVPLFDRVGTRLRLTRTGELVAREARRVLESVREFRAAVADVEGGVRGVLRVGGSTTPGNYFLPEILARFERRHPRARTDLRIGNSARVLELVRSHETDLGFVGFDPASEDLAAQPVAEDEIVAFVSPRHPLARARRIPPERLAAERFLLREPASATRRLCDVWMTRQKLRPSVMELENPETLKRTAAAGLGIGILSRMAIAWEVAERRLVPIRLPGLPLRRRLHAVRHRQKHLSQAVLAFLEMLPGTTQPVRRRHRPDDDGVDEHEERPERGRDDP